MLELASGTVELAVEDVLIDTVQKEGVFTVSDKGVTVALDTELTEEQLKFISETVNNFTIDG